MQAKVGTLLCIPGNTFALMLGRSCWSARLAFQHCSERLTNTQRSNEGAPICAHLAFSPRSCKVEPTICFTFPCRQAPPHVLATLHPFTGQMHSLALADSSHKQTSGSTLHTTGYNQARHIPYGCQCKAESPQQRLLLLCAGWACPAAPQS